MSCDGWPSCKPGCLVQDPRDTALSLVSVCLIFNFLDKLDWTRPPLTPPRYPQTTSYPWKCRCWDLDFSLIKGYWKSYVFSKLEQWPLLDIPLSLEGDLRGKRPLGHLYTLCFPQSPSKGHHHRSSPTRQRLENLLGQLFLCEEALEVILEWFY